MTGQQRAGLRKQANTLSPVTQIGKDNLSPALIHSLEEAMDRRGLIKVSVLETSELSAQEAAEEIAQRTGAEVIQCIGRKFVIYREPKDNSGNKE
jgi:RNA-binding protein